MAIEVLDMPDVTDLRHVADLRERVRRAAAEPVRPPLTSRSPAVAAHPAGPAGSPGTGADVRPRR
jgi:hypothetical protein